MKKENPMMGLSILRFAVARGKIVATTKSHKYYVFMAMYVFFSARRRVFIRNFSDEVRLCVIVVWRVRFWRVRCYRPAK